MLDSISQTPQFQTGEAEFTFIGEGPQVDKINSNPNVKLDNPHYPKNYYLKSYQIRCSSFS